MSVGGGADAKDLGTISASAINEWKAANDGFFQLQAKCQNPTNTVMMLELIDKDGAVAATVTPEGALGDLGEERRYVWTVPVRKDDTVSLMLDEGELTLVKGQFIYFGVAE